MRDLVAEVKPYLKEFSQWDSGHSEQPTWVKSVRGAALEHFAKLGFPTLKNEQWKYTNLAELSSIPFSVEESHELTWQGEVEAVTKHQLIVFQGQVISGLDSLPEGVTVSALSESWDQPNVKAQLNQTGSMAPMKALNSAFLHKGLVFHVEKGTQIEEPVEVVYLGAGHHQVSHLRNFITLEANSRLSLFERFESESKDEYWHNIVAEVSVGEGARFSHYKFQDEGRAAFHTAAVEVDVQKDGQFDSFFFSRGGKLVRHEIQVHLNGSGSSTDLSGLFLTDGGQHVDNHTVIDHAKPHCNSREVYRGVLNGQSSGVFDGRVLVREDAQKTDSSQSNKNLLLSDLAEVNSKPQLEIYADDVKCAHGATTGQLDEESIFYLRSRGIALAEARKLLTVAFAREVVESCSDPLLKKWFSQELEKWVPLHCQAQEGL